MSYAISSALQAAVFQRLSNDAALVALVSGNIFDAIPSGSVPAIYVALGPEKVRDASDNLAHGAWHEFTISVVSESPGFAQAKEAAGIISDALVDADLVLTRGTLIGLRFRRATAARVGTGDMRRIDMVFRARVSDT
ncbi:DUF3168 domain-containing protein [Yoonia sp. R2331]|uniref:DUF3168 domain-containing protein n=1 Tax=Yoonia sp. R2331 TaxID=3237238 RepID=UPI0034E4B37A